MRLAPLLVALAASVACGRPRVPVASDPVAGDAGTRVLPAATITGGPGLYETLAHRRSARSFGTRALRDDELGQLLWAAQGITGPDGLRTAPSAGALYPLTVLVADPGGLWRYDPAAHALAPLRTGDARAAIASATGQGAARAAAVLLVVIARPSVTAAKYGARAERYVALEAGHVAQNVLLAATALELRAVPIGSFDDDALRAAVGAGDDELPLYVLAIGAPP